MTEEPRVGDKIRFYDGDEGTVIKVDGSKEHKLVTSKYYSNKFGYMNEYTFSWYTHLKIRSDFVIILHRKPLIIIT